MRTRLLSFLGLSAMLACSASSGRSSQFKPDDKKAVQPTVPTGFGDNDRGSAGMEVSPRNMVVFNDTATDPVTPASLTFSVTTSDGTDVSEQATFGIDKDAVGHFDGATFVANADFGEGERYRTAVVSIKYKNDSTNTNVTVVSARRSGESKDFFFIMPFGKDPNPNRDVLPFSTKLQQVDVAFVMDTTGSMSGSIDNLRTALNGSLLAKLKAAVPSVGLAVVDHKDYPVGGHGSGPDFPVKVYQYVTDDLNLVKAGVAKYVASGGGDGPEAQIPAMYHTLTGEALRWAGGQVPAHVPATGTTGGVDFRAGSLPIVALVTDVDWHGEGHQPYEFATPTMAHLKQAFTDANARFISITSGDESQANDLSDFTNSNLPPSALVGMGGGCGAGQCCTGASGAGRAPTGPSGRCRLNFLHQNGQGVSDSIVNAIQAIAAGSTFDIVAVPENAEDNPEGFDATKFIKSLRAMEEGDAANGCPPGRAEDRDGDGINETFVETTVGTPVCFEVIPNKNVDINETTAPQFFKARFVIRGNPGDVRLDSRDVYFLVPPSETGPR